MTAAFQRLKYIDIPGVIFLRRTGESKRLTKREDKIKTVSMNEKIGMLYVMPDNAQELGCREEQQDYFAYNDIFDMDVVKKFGCAAVLSDGMGGLKNGRDAAVAGVEAFLQSYRDYADESDDIDSAMREALLDANEAVKRCTGAGATMVAVIVKGSCLNWISVGDSRIYLFRNNCLRQLNREHTYAEELDSMYRRGEISREEALNNPERRALTSYLGLPEIVNIDHKSDFHLLPHDIIMLCSDGLYNTLSDDEISNILSSESETIAEDLTRASLIKNNIQQDNITVVLLKII